MVVDDCRPTLVADDQNGVQQTSEELLVVDGGMDDLTHQHVLAMLEVEVDEWALSLANVPDMFRVVVQ